MAELLLELYCEEIPFSAQKNEAPKLAENLLKNIATQFANAEIEMELFTAPTRISIVLRDIPLATNEETLEIRGPKTTAPAIATENFLKKAGKKTVEELEVRNGYYFSCSTTPPAPSKDKLPQIISNTIMSFTWIRSMRWGSKNMTWIRPINNILCIFAGEPLQITVEDIANENKTWGHKFMHHSASAQISSYAEYQNFLQQNKVILNQDQRKAIIAQDIKQLLEARNLNVVYNDYLLENITALVEYPKVYLGTIEEEFMKLPREVLITVLKNHQKCLMVQDSSGNLAPFFIIVANIIPQDEGKQIITGNEKVVRARLADAKFFFETDLGNGIQYMQSNLATRLYHKDIGSVLDKTTRNIALAAKISQSCGVDSAKAMRAAELCKFDLTSEMVGEFPELQGIMAKYYALHSEIPHDIAEAIGDHYKPQGPNDEIPSTILGAVVALADKLDAISSLFAINIKPTGSKDPYALRRAAIGINRITEHYQLKLDYNNLGISNEVVEFILAKAA